MALTADDFLEIAQDKKHARISARLSRLQKKYGISPEKAELERKKYETERSFIPLSEKIEDLRSEIKNLTKSMETRRIYPKALFGR